MNSKDVEQIWQLTGFLMLGFFLVTIVGLILPVSMDIIVKLVLLLVLFSGPPIIKLLLMYRQRLEEIQQLKDKYEQAKAELRKKPNSSKLREAALLAGRAYYNRYRNISEPTLLDEQVIANDLRTITGTDPDS